MSHINNIFNIRVNSVSSNGSINFGNVIIKGNSANSKSVGGQSVIGDMIRSAAYDYFNKSVMNDPDLIDQSSKQL